MKAKCEVQSPKSEGNLRPEEYSETCAAGDMSRRQTSEHEQGPTSAATTSDEERGANATVHTGERLHLLLLAGVGIAAFHLAWLVPVCAPVIVVFLGCLVAMAGPLGSARRAFNWGVPLGLAIYAPHLHFFWNVFVGPAANALEKSIAILGVCALWMVLPVWLGLFLALATFARRRLNLWAAMLVIPFLWTGIEYFRSELYPLRFSWMGIGYSFHALPGILSWTGVYGIGFILCLVASTSLLSWRVAACSGRIQACGLCVLGVLAWAGYSASPAPSDRGEKVVGIQYEFAPAGVVLQGLDAARRAHPDARLFVLNEYAFDGPVPDRVRAWCREHHCQLIAGGRVPLGETNFYNTAFVVSTDGEVIFQQVKAQPVQFFKDGLPAPEQRVWESLWGQIGLCICYDLSYTRVTDALIRQGAQMLIVPTMDGESWGRYQHSLHARIAPARAAECHIPIFRVASSGISQAVTKNGVVSATAPFPGQGAVLVGRLQTDSYPYLPLDRYVAVVSVAVTALLMVGALVFPFLPASSRAKAPPTAALS